MRWYVHPILLPPYPHADARARPQFADPTSYQALFYFLVIKPPIVLILLLALLVLAPVCIVLVLPAPAFLRAVRRVGAWQAGVAVEGLWCAVR